MEETETMLAVKFCRQLGLMPWGDESNVYIDNDGERLAIERVMIDQSNGDIIIVATPNE